MYRKASQKYVAVLSGKNTPKQIQLKYSALSDRYKSEFSIVNTQSSPINFEIKENPHLAIKPESGTLAPNESATVKVVLRPEVYEMLPSAKLESVDITMMYEDESKKTKASPLYEQQTVKASMTEDAYLHLRTDLSHLGVPTEQRVIRVERPDFYSVFTGIRVPTGHTLKVFGLAAFITCMIYFDICFSTGA